jgi:hypothetical protein
LPLNWRAAASGVATSRSVRWSWKGTVDRRIEQIERTRAEKDVAAERMTTVDKIGQNVTWLVRQRKGA